ncbi:MAG: hypothetical protein E7137_05470 [Rikenellaceae bacterium]|nr:hypothetical protein [Rikenellaceae bacterium]
MKKYIILFTFAMTHISVYAQWSFMDYRDGKTFSTDSVHYKIINHLEKFILDQGETFEFYKEIMSENSEGIRYIVLERSSSFRIGGSQYADGTPVVYSEYADEVAGIIIPQAYYRTAIYHAVRTAFSKEEELIPFADKTIYIRVVVNPQGDILETSTAFPIWKSHVFQPEQIATLESLIRKNLKFELSPKARNFNYFEGQITIPFRHYIEDLPEAVLKEVEESFGNLPYLEGGNLTDLPKAGGGN